MLPLASKFGSHPQAQSLVAPFTQNEIDSSLDSVDVKSSPGLDGFGPAFNNPIGTLSNMISFMSCPTSFHTRQILNVLKAFIALIPNKQGAIHSDNFRPVSPQN